MTLRHLIGRSLFHYWRTNLAVIAGVGIAVAVLAGALIVGDSVKASLRDLALTRLGRVDQAVLSTGFFREQLAEDILSGIRDSGLNPDTVPVIMIEGFVMQPISGRRASRVQVYGIDDRFYQFHELSRISAPEGNQALLSEGLADEIGTASGESVLLRVETASPIPTESLHGRKEDVGRTLRLTVRQVLTTADLGEFSMSPRQGSVRAIFVPLGRLQTLLQQPGRVNAILVAGTGTDLERIIREAVLLEDLGLKLRALPDQESLALESESTIIPDAVASAARATGAKVGMSTLPVLTYLANSIRFGDREIPYSVIAAIDFKAFWLSADLDAQSLKPKAQSLEPGARSPESGAIILNEWAASELRARVGDEVSVEYYVWEAEGRLTTQRADFRIARLVPIEGAAADRTLVPQYPGITDSERISDWDPPFPIDLGRIRPADEEYWNRYRATPKAFISIEIGQQLWGSRYGSLTSLRIRPTEPAASRRLREGGPAGMDRYKTALRSDLDPFAFGFSVYDVRAQNLAASAGATDFGEYFAYFSAFLVVSALLLAALFFKLGVEQRLQEIGLLQALGLDPAAIRRLFLSEGLVLSTLAGFGGIAGAIGYGAIIMLGLRTWWVDAVGTTALTLHLTPRPLLLGAIGVIAAAMACIWWSLRALTAFSARSLLHGEKGVRPLFQGSAQRKRGRTPFSLGGIAVVLALLVLVLLIAAATESISRVGGFFGAGALSLIASLCAAAVWLRGRRHHAIRGHGWWPVWRLGLRNATCRPARSVLCIALIASATFVIVSVEAFKRDDTDTLGDRSSGSGGYPLLAESLLPIVHDLNSPEGRDALNLPVASELGGVRFDRFRVRPGDDASCLNLYQPKNPRVLAPTADFIAGARFSFQSSMAETDLEAANPWLLLNREFSDGAIPVITDANSMTYVLHMKLGDEIVLPGVAPARSERGESKGPARLRLVAALADSIFQGELLMSERNFVRTFPEWEGYRFFLLDAPPNRTADVTRLLETRLADFGIDVGSTAERLAGFHRVEYTYLSTFQMLGGLGLVLGTLGLGAVLLRNVLERRRELAVMRAFGYGQGDFLTMVVAENILLLVSGLTAGVACALLAIAPVFVDRGGRLPVATLSVLLLGVMAAGLLASLGATLATLRSPLLPALRAE